MPIVALGMLLLSGCASVMEWPVVVEPPAEPRISGRWVWTELITADVESAKSFYGSLFGWTYESIGEGDSVYTLIRSNGTAIGGMLHDEANTAAVPSAYWLGSMAVDDVDAAVERATAASASVLLAPRHLPGHGEVAILADPEGGRFALLDAESGDPPDRFPTVGTFLWRELWAKDGAAMAHFYADVGGTEVLQVANPSSEPEWHLFSDGYPRAGIVEESIDDLPSAWLQYVRVEAIDAAVQAAEAAGATLLVAPNPAVRDGAVAVIVDPMGGAIGLVEWRDTLLRDYGQ